MKTLPILSLEEISKSIRYGYTASASDDEVGPKFLRITDIAPSQINWETVPYCMIDEKNFSKYCLKPGDIVIARTGATVGYAKLIRNGMPLSVFASYLVRVRIDSQKADPEYIGRVVESNIYKRFVLSRIGGAAQPNANAKVLSSFRLPIPKEATQRYIAFILSSYDNLIDTNRRRIQLLEEAARFLFREWFVYFRSPLRLGSTSLTTSCSGQAGHEKVKIVDGVPEGWGKRRLVEIADIVMGQSPKSEYYNDDGMGLPFHQGVTGFGDRYPTNQIYCTQKNRMAQTGDILFSVRAPVGRINISTEKIIIGRGLSAIRSKDNHQSYLFHELKNHFFKEDMIGVGAIFAAITKNDLENVVVIYPDEKTIEQFESITNPIDMQIEILSKQNQKLAQARDLLLPRLMSGKIKV